MQDRAAAAKKPRSARQKCERAKGEDGGVLASRHKVIIITKALQELLAEEEEARERARDEAAHREQAARRRRHWTAEELAGEEEEEEEAPAAPESPVAPLLRDVGLEKAKTDAQRALSENRDVEHVLEALQRYYHGSEGRLARRGALPDHRYLRAVTTLGDEDGHE